MKDYCDDILLINKPVGWTSHDVVKKLKHVLKVKKIGHAGTLDPLAVGLLIIGIEKGTKKLHEYQALNKEYTGIIEIGKTTSSYDLETPFCSPEKDWKHLTEINFAEATSALKGNIQQVPPMHSAIKINGERAYKKARKNQNVTLQPRSVVVDQFDIDISNLPEVGFKITCSKGTYIRSLAKDFGDLLEVGGYLKKLKRTKIGDFSLDEAYSLATFLKEYQ